MKLSKIKIDELAREVMDFLIKNEIDNDVLIYYNNKRIQNKHKYDESYNYIGSELVIEDNMNPHDYFECAWQHILSMSFEGSLYDCINYSGKYIDEFNAILEKYGLYYEQYNAWNLSCYPLKDDIDNYEYTNYSNQKPKPVINLYYHEKEKYLPEIRHIMETWYIKSSKYGDVGSCVLGAGFKFEYKNNMYFMSPCSPYQGSCSWEASKDIIELMLKEIGAENISYDWGNMD